MVGKNEALRKMEAADTKGRRIPFSIVFVTANRAAWQKKKKLMERGAPQSEIDTVEDDSGRIIRHPRCVLSGKRGIHSRRAALKKTDESELQRNPNHWKNRTRNILMLPSDQIRKLNISCIMRLNNEEVHY